MDVSDDELLKDIYNTELEVDAYYNIKQGFSVLSSLPENKTSNRYAFEYYRYMELENECRAFLDRLYRIKEDRGIQDEKFDLA